MANTADLQQSVWTDPWFLNLTTDAKCLYLWAVTTPHGNLAGVFTVAAPIIQLETGLTPARFDVALTALEGKLDYFPESGALWVRGKAKHTRSKTTQIARSIGKAVAACPERAIQVAFITKYGESAWLKSDLQDLALEQGNVEPQPNLGEVLGSRSRSRSLKEVPTKSTAKNPVEDRDQLPEGFPANLIPSVDATLPILQRVAKAKKARAVDRLPLARTIAALPDRDHPMVAGELEHWSLYGRGERKTVRDVVAMFRNFLKNADRMAGPPGQPSAVSKYEKYDQTTERIAV